MTSPAKQIEARKLSELHPHPNNVRVHSQDQLDRLARSIKEFGLTKPVVIDENNIILAGHGTVAAAIQAGLDEIQVAVATGWSEEKKRAYIIADNKIGLDSSWDEAALVAELRKIEKEIDLEITGFDDDDLKDLEASLHGFSLSDAPPSVKENASDIETIRQRRKGNEEKASKSDTEHYIVVVYPDRESRERALSKLGMPHDERYVTSKAVRLEPRGQLSQISATRSTKVASVKHSGATG